MNIIKDFFDIGWYVFPEAHNINVWDGVLQITSWNIMIYTWPLVVGTIVALVFVFNFVQGYRGK